MANALGLAKGTAHGILRTLQEVGFVAQDRTSGKYLLGSGLFALTVPHLDPNELRSLALNWTDSLAARSGETVRLGVLDAGSVLVASHGFRPDDTEQVLEVGTRRPAHACALGKVLLAHDPGAVALLHRRPLQGYTPRTTVDPRALAARAGPGPPAGLGPRRRAGRDGRRRAGRAGARPRRADGRRGRHHRQRWSGCATARARPARPCSPSCWMLRGPSRASSPRPEPAPP